VLTAVAILSLLVLAVLAAPLAVAFSVDRARDPWGQLGIRWLFGLVRFRTGLPPAGSTRASRVKKKPAGAGKKRRFAGGARGVARLLGDSSLRRRVARLAAGLLRAVQVRDLFLRLRVGLGDPADTGRLWAVLGPAAAIAGGLRGADVRVEPAFTEQALDVEGRGALRVVPLRVIALGIAFMLSPATLRAVSLSRRGGT